MKALLVSILSLYSQFILAQSVRSPLTLNVTGLRNTNGRVCIAIFKSQEGFPEDVKSAVYSHSIKPVGQLVSISDSLPPGNYAAVVMHDENDDAQLDKNLIGFPKEGFAISNGLRSRLHTPTFHDAKFQLTGRQTINLKMVYY